MPVDLETETSLLAILRKFNEGFANCDLEGLIELFGTEPNLMFLGSGAEEQARTHSELRMLLGGLLADYQSVSLEWGQPIIAASGSVAWLTVTARIYLQQGDRTTTIPYRLTGVFVKQGERWLWMQYHGSEPADSQGPTN